MPATISFKRGDTLVLNNTVRVNGAVTNITGWTIRCQLRDNQGQLVAALTPTITNAVAGEYKLQSPTATTGWATGKLRADIEYTTAAGQIVSTDTFYVSVVPDVTV